jgi:hypothetical protein
MTHGRRRRQTITPPGTRLSGDPLTTLVMGDRLLVYVLDGFTSAISPIRFLLSKDGPVGRPEGCPIIVTEPSVGYRC